MIERLIQFRESHTRAGQQHVLVRLGDVLENLQVHPRGVDVPIEPLVRPELHDQDEALVHRHAEFFLPPQLPPRTAEHPAHHVAAHEDVQALEKVEIDVRIDAGDVGDFLKRPLHLLARQALEVGPFHQSRELPEQLLLILRPFLLGMRVERFGVGVRVEGGVGVLEFLQLLEVLEVKHGRDQRAELAERLALRGRQFFVLGEQFDEVALAQRDEMLAVLVLGHGRTLRDALNEWFQTVLCSPFRFLWEIVGEKRFPPADNSSTARASGTARKRSPPDSTRRSFLSCASAALSRHHSARSA